ncbi:hypothetical protein A0H81_08057 [Grifola frondosa]|uniref:Uncharacterized protein n=1 Tax=Grifola frondosa TaxID=5627 RepID=A0A1C7M6C8_GRIFR|nr:hypothetical protein A0H81_08057 [Grifola frondosa]
MGSWISSGTPTFTSRMWTLLSQLHIDVRTDALRVRVTTADAISRLVAAMRTSTTSSECGAPRMLTDTINALQLDYEDQKHMLMLSGGPAGGQVVGGGVDGCSEHSPMVYDHMVQFDGAG